MKVCERLANSLKVVLPDAGVYKVELLDFRGRQVGGAVSDAGSAEIRMTGIHAGLHIVRAAGAGKVLSLPIVF